jgi:hypothetical protein
VSVAARSVALVAALAASFLGTLASCGGRQATGPRSSEVFGVNAQLTFALPRAALDRSLRALARSGVDVVRSDAGWNGVEPRPPARPSGLHHYFWVGPDETVGTLARHGLRWYPILDYSAPWAASRPGDLLSRPGRDRDFAAWSAAVARRYGRRGSFWRSHPDLPRRPVLSYEVWNEPNSRTFWHPQRAAPERYAALYRATRTAVHRVDPRASVVLGGLTVFGPGAIGATRFVSRVAARLGGLEGRVDAVGLHPYAPTVERSYDWLRGFRRALNRWGGARIPIEITELGWSTVDTPERVRAARLERLARELPRSDCGVRTLIVYAWVTPRRDRHNLEDWFGIAGRGGRPGPSAGAFFDGLRAARRSGHVRICSGSLRPADRQRASHATVQAPGAIGDSP